MRTRKKTSARRKAKAHRLTWLDQVTLIVMSDALRTANRLRSVLSRVSSRKMDPLPIAETPEGDDGGGGNGGRWYVAWYDNDDVLQGWMEAGNTERLANQVRQRVQSQLGNQGWAVAMNAEPTH